MPALDVGAHLGLVAYPGHMHKSESNLNRIHSRDNSQYPARSLVKFRTRFKIVARNSHESCVDKGFHETHVGIRLIIGYDYGMWRSKGQGVPGTTKLKISYSYCGRG